MKDDSQGSGLLKKVASNKTNSDQTRPTEEAQEILQEQGQGQKPVGHPLTRCRAWFRNLSKPKKAGLVLTIVITLVGIVAAIWLIQKPKPMPPKPEAKKAKTVVVEPKPVPVVSELTGLPTTAELAKRGVTGVMIENSPDARPQSGLTEAGVVYEAIAEGGITRFLTLFQEAQPAYIGPVRSVRPYYLDWISGYDAPIAHAGGSADAKQYIKDAHLKDLDALSNSGAFHRVSNRYAPHNLYTSMSSLDKLKQQKGFTETKFKGFLRKAEQPAKTPAAQTIDFTMSGFYYNPHYVYNATTNSYDRSEGGKPHTDEKSGKQISPKVVIANIMAIKLQYNGVNTQYSDLGTGQCFIFQDGIVTTGHWQKSTRTSPMTFVDDAGKEIPLNPGQTWITAVSLASGVKYKP